MLLHRFEMFTSLLLLCLVLMAALFSRHCLRDGKIHINPAFGFFTGMGFYVLLPCSFMTYSGASLSDLTAYGSALSPQNALWVIAYTAAVLVAVWIGSFWAAGRAPRTPVGPAMGAGPQRRHRRPRWDVSVILLFAAYGLFMLLAVSIRDVLFSGYADAVLDNEAVWSTRGTMSSAYALLSVAMLLLALRPRPVSKGLRRAIGFAFLSASVVLLSIGARLYVAMALLSLLSLHSMRRGGIAATRLLGYLAGAALVLGSIGVLRQDPLTGLSNVALNLVLEPLVTCISLFTLLGENPTIWFGKPYLFPAEFQALLPSVLFPGKAGLFDRLNDYGYAFEAPIGGYHLYFSALINFGVVGTLMIAVAGGYWLARLSGGHRFRRRSTAVASAFLTGALTFTLYRDPFFISVVKNIVVMALLVPWAVTSVAWYGSRRTRSTACAGSP